MKPDTFIIIQARTGSTRLPEKTILPFFQEKSIFSLMAGNLAEEFGKSSLVLATTSSPADDRLVELARAEGINVFRGNEADVLGRFIAAAKQVGAKTIVRICSDNPFLFPCYVRQLIDEFEKEPCDYLSFRDDHGVPVIRTHWGLFAEITTLDALERADAQTREPFFHEHVTNFLYGNPAIFNLRFLEMPALFRGRSGYRFTLDTAEDFELLRILYLNLFEQYHTRNFTPEQVFEYLDHKGGGILAAMKLQIEKNAK